jgi:hypothetical protein
MSWHDFVPLLEFFGVCLAPGVVLGLLILGVYLFYRWAYRRGWRQCNRDWEEGYFPEEIHPIIGLS